MAFVTAPDGTQGEVPDDQLEQAVAQGFRPRQASPEELARAQAGDQNAVAALEAFGRGVIPFGGADIIANIGADITGATPLEQLESQRLRREENPIANALGTGAGFAAGTQKLLGGATAPLRARGLLGAAAAGSLEGGLMGLNEAVNESILENTPLTAEQTAASVMGGALSGGAVDFGLSAVGKGTSAILKKAGGQGLRETLNRWSDDLVKAELVTKSALKKYGTADYIDDIIGFGRREGIITPGTTYESGLAAAEEALKARQPMYDLVLDGLEGVKPATTEAKSVVDDVAKALKKYDRGLLADEASRVLGDIEQVAMQQGVTWRELHAMQSELFARIPPTGASSATKRVLNTAQRALSETIEKRLDLGLEAMADAGQLAPELQAMGVGSGSFMKKLSRDYASAKRLEEMFRDQVLSSEARGIGIKELGLAGAAGIATGGPVGAGVAIGGSFLGKMARERGGFVLSGALRSLSESDMLNRVANSFSNNVKQRLMSAPELLGPFRAMVEQASAQGSMDLLQTHLELANSVQGQDYLSRMGMEPESGGQMAVMSSKLASLEAVRNAALAEDANLNGAIDGLFGAARGRKGALKPPSMDARAYRSSIESIRSVLRDPEGVYARVPPDITSAAPMAMGQAAATIVNAARFLDSKAPKNPYYGMPESVAPKWEPDAVSLDRYARYKEAVEQPAKVLKNMANGYIAPEQVEAIKAVYPALYSELQQRIGERLAMTKKPLTYQQRLAVSTVVGPSALGMSPQQVQVLQQTQFASSAGNDAQQSGMSKPDGRQKVDQEKNLQTQAQRLEGR